MILLMGPMADSVLANVCARLAVRNADLMLVIRSRTDRTDISWSTRAVGWGALSQPSGCRYAVSMPCLRSRRPVSPTPRERWWRRRWEFAESLQSWSSRRQARFGMSKPYQQRLISSMASWFRRRCDDSAGGGAPLLDDCRTSSTNPSVRSDRS